MQYKMTTPCADCPFLKAHRKHYSRKRIAQFAAGEFHCHKTGTCTEDEDGNEVLHGYVPTGKSQHCAGALIYNEKRDKPHQMMRIMERVGMYDPSKLNMKAKV
jgi:hypothetical protein